MRLTHTCAYREIEVQRLDEDCAIGPAEVSPAKTAEWLAAASIRVLNLAGTRESKAKGIELAVVEALDERQARTETAFLADDQGPAVRRKRSAGA